MNHELTPAHIDAYRADGFVIIEDFLDAAELETWRSTVDDAVAERNGKRFDDESIMRDEFNDDVKTEFYDKVFDQMVNLWKTHDPMRELILDPRIGEMAAKLASLSGVRVWHDQALIKRPYANPTAFHLDAPYWSFTSKDAISLWIALDDATATNGCLYFFPGSHLETTLDNVAIGPNLGAIFEPYPQFAKRPATSGAMKAGSCSFHNGLTIHGAGANMTSGQRRAMTCAFMPERSVFNGQPNILSDRQLAELSVGDPIDDAQFNPLVWSESTHGT